MQGKFWFRSKFFIGLVLILFIFRYWILGFALIYAQQSNANLDVDCYANKASANVGEVVTWTAQVVNGVGPFQYVWQGTNNLGGNTKVITTTYNNPGIQTVVVGVYSNTTGATATCSSSINIIGNGTGSNNLTTTTNAVSNQVRDRLMGSCIVYADIESDGKMRASWETSLRNDSATTTFAWSGTDNLSGSTPFLQKFYDTPGQKNAQVTINSGGDVVTFNCGANFQKTNIPLPPPAPSLSASCNPTVTGMDVTWNSIFSSTFNGSIDVNWNIDGVATTSNPAQQTYTTEGVKTGTVRVSSGGNTLTLTCQALVASSSSSHCFIATAAYGTSFEPEVEVLRNFRDETLEKSELGKKFVDTYYSVSQPIADFIRPHESLKVLVRAGLSPIILGLEMAGYTND
jgi:hypothetical protein